MVWTNPGDQRRNFYSWKDYDRFRDKNHVFSDLIALWPGRFQVTNTTIKPAVADGVYVVGNFFDVLGLRPAIGRLIGPQETGSDLPAHRGPDETLEIVGVVGDAKYQ